MYKKLLEIYIVEIEYSIKKLSLLLKALNKEYQIEVVNKLYRLHYSLKDNSFNVYNCLCDSKAINKNILNNIENIQQLSWAFGVIILKIKEKEITFSNDLVGLFSKFENDLYTIFRCLIKNNHRTYNIKRTYNKMLKYINTI